MAHNTGIIEFYTSTSSGGGVLINIYYDPILTGGEIVLENQPIINVNGAALRAINDGDKPAIMRVSGPSGKFLGLDGQGDIEIPVGETTITANQLRAGAGIETRADVGAFSLTGASGATDPSPA